MHSNAEFRRLMMEQNANEVAVRKMEVEARLLEAQNTRNALQMNERMMELLANIASKLK
jgi:hypothetical protein